MKTVSTEKNGPQLPEFKYSSPVGIIIAVLLIVFVGANVILMPLLGLEPIQNNDEEGAILAFVISVAVSFVLAIAGAVVAVFVKRKAERAAHERKCKEITDEFNKQEAQKAQQRIAEEKRQQRIKEQERALRKRKEALTVCEFCKNKLLITDSPDISYNASYTESVTATVKNGSLNLKANTVGYGVKTGTDKYSCPECKYVVHAHYDILVGSWGESKSYKYANITFDDGATVGFNAIQNGRLYTSIIINGK